MAEVSSWGSYKLPEERAAEENASPTWTDYGKTLKAGAEELGAAAGAGLQYLGEESGGNDTYTNVLGAIGSTLREYMGDYAKGDIETLSPVAKKRLESAITSSDFWSHPLSATALKTTRMSPMLVAGVIPGGLMADAAGAGLAAAGTMGAIGAGQSAEQFYRMVGDASDEDLQQQSKFYRELRDSGMSEDSARQRLTAKLRGAEPLINGLVGAVTGLFGPAATAARGLKGAAGVIGAGERGVLGRAGLGAAEGTVAGGIQGGVMEYGAQQATTREGLQEGFDEDRLVNAVLEPALLQGVLGGGIGAAARARHGQRPREAAVLAPERAPQEIPEKAIDEATGETVRTPESVGPGLKGYRSGEPAPPAEDVPVGDKQNAPTRSPREYPKTAKAKAIIPRRRRCSRWLFVMKPVTLS